MEPRRRARKRQVVIPDFVRIPHQLEFPEIPGDLPEPHFYTGRGLISRRGHWRAHHRIQIARPERVRYVTRDVVLPDFYKEYEAYMSHWRAYRGGIHLVHHYHPARKMLRQVNRKQRDWKHANREDPDSGRADALRAIDHRGGMYQLGLYGALNSGSPLIAENTAVVIANLDPDFNGAREV